MGRIFVSYAHEDRDSAERLARLLDEHHHAVWWDRHLEGGEEFSSEIETELDAAEIVIVAWSKASVKSRWVRDEAAAGGDSGRLLPISLDGSLPPIGFRQFHTLDLSGWKGGKRDPRLAELVHSVDKRLARKRIAPAAAPPSDAPPAKRAFAVSRRWLTAAAVLAVVLAGAVGAWLFTNSDAAGSAPLKPTIALVPFVAASSDPALAQIAIQSRDSIAHAFSQSGVPVSIVSAVPQAGHAGVDFLIGGNFARSGGKIVATIRLDEAATGTTVFSHQFEAGSPDAESLPERIGAQMAGNLTWGSPLLILDRRHPIEPALMADLLKASDFGGDPLQGYQAERSVAEKAPEIGAAQLGVAFDTAFVLDQLPRSERAEAVAVARRAADRAAKLLPRFGDRYATWCLLHSETMLAECERKLRDGRRVDPDAPFLNTFLSHLLRNVGRFEESGDLARLAHAHDPFVPSKIGWQLKSIEYDGDRDAARQLYQKSIGWWPEFQGMYFRNRSFGLLDRADFAGIRQLELEIGPKETPPGYRDSTALLAALKSRSAVAAKQACQGTDALLVNTRCMLALATLGDLDGAYAIADKLYPRRVGRNDAETEQIWLDEPDGTAPLEFVTSPASAPLRRDLRYLALAERVGLLAYWRSGPLPDFCRINPEPICPRLRHR